MTYANRRHGVRILLPILLTDQCLPVDSAGQCRSAMGHGGVPVTDMVHAKSDYVGL